MTMRTHATWRAKAALFAFTVLAAAGAYAQSTPVRPDPVLGPNATPTDPALAPDQTSPAAVLSPDAVRTDPALSPQQTTPGPVLSPGAVPTDPALSPDQTNPAPVLAPTPGDSLAPLPPIYPNRN
jgi:hypothetical protein